MWLVCDIGIGYEISLFIFRIKMGKICIIIKYVIDFYFFVCVFLDYVIIELLVNGKFSDVRIFL